jgi:hypothetical protein
MKHKCIFFLLVATYSTWQVAAQMVDEPYTQLVGHPYEVPGGFGKSQPKKVVVDYNNIVYVLTDKGLYRDFPDYQLAPDHTYRSLADKVPVDITTQESTGILFYLYKDKFLTNGYAGTLDTKLEPELYSRISVSKDLRVLLMGEMKAALFDGNRKIADLTVPKEAVIDIYVAQGQFLALTAKAIYKLEGKAWKTMHEGLDMTSLAFSESGITVGTKNGYYTIDGQGKRITDTDSRLPVPDIRKMLLTGNNELWFSTADGAFRKETDRYRYFASKRWLDVNEVVDMAADANGNIYLLTSNGLNMIEQMPFTLAEKTEFFQDRIRKYHMRYGFVCAPQLPVAYDLTSEEIIDHDNDGLWTSFYLGSQVFRYSVTGEEVAKRYVWESFEAFERLLTVNQLKGFPSRTFEREGYKVNDPDRWRKSPEEGWEWKGTTSSDEYIAYLFVAALMDQFIAKAPEEKKRVADFIDGIMTHILDNDYYFVDLDGKPTTWGKWNPEYVNMYPSEVYDRKLNSMHLVAGLQLAYALTKKERYKTEMFKVMNEFGYFKNMLPSMYDMKEHIVMYDGHTMGDGWNHSDDEMAFLTYWPLYHYALNDTLKQHYADIITDHWKIELPERNALWNLLTYGTAGDINQEDVRWHLQEFGLDQMSYIVKNSHRQDLELLEPNFRGQTTKVLLTPGERRTHRHNANPFELDGGSEGNSVLAGDEYLLPYWMARYLGVLK